MMNRFENLKPEEIAVLRFGLYILIDDYETGATDDKSEYETAKKLYEEIGKKYYQKENG